LTIRANGSSRPEPKKKDASSSPSICAWSFVSSGFFELFVETFILDLLAGFVSGLDDKTAGTFVECVALVGAGVRPF
jgi:hypothetical protein